MAPSACCGPAERALGLGREEGQGTRKARVVVMVVAPIRREIRAEARARRGIFVGRCG